MAKHKDQDMSNGSGAPFVLEDGAWGEVESHVGTLNIERADGTTQKFAKSDLQVKKQVQYTNGNTATIDTWRFTGTRYMPFPRAGADSDVLGNLAAFVDALKGFDAASEFVLPNGRKGRKGYTLLVNSKGERISAEQYLYQLVVAAHTLASQKVMQAKLRDTAEKTLRAEMGIEAPVTKARVRKEESVVIDDAEIDNSL